VSLLFELQRVDMAVSVLMFPELAALCAAEEPVMVAVPANGISEAELTERVEAARVEGFEDGLAAGESRRRHEIETERSAVQMLCSSFAQERSRYFADAESEVVRLALAIASQVLQRESSIDPALLRDVVKVALSKMGDAKGAVLRMPSEDVAAWRDEMKHAAVEIMGDDAMQAGKMRLEVAGSVAELGVAQQMEEIESGFFDLLKKRPA